ncbi:MAG: hypothetical protein JRD89_00780 [Deltaproteobacteria bacterium]|nr:hypothetical protein [Deltaproteobacteria bacterium]
MALGQKGQTAGRVINTPYGTRVYWKPSLGKIVFRKPGVIRTSDRVIERNRKWAAAPPASKCKGLPWREFVRCLSKEAPR